MGHQVEQLAGIRIEQNPRVRTAVVEAFPKGMKLSADERMVLFSWALAVLEGNDLDYEIRPVGDSYALQCHGQILVIERERSPDLEAIVAALKVMVNQLKLPDGAGQ